MRMENDTFYWNCSDFIDFFNYLIWDSKWYYKNRLFHTGTVFLCRFEKWPKSNPYPKRLFLLCWQGAGCLCWDGARGGCGAARGPRLEAGSGSCCCLAGGCCRSLSIVRRHRGGGGGGGGESAGGHREDGWAEGGHGGHVEWGGAGAPWAAGGQRLAPGVLRLEEQEGGARSLGRRRLAWMKKIFW